MFKRIKEWLRRAGRKKNGEKRTQGGQSTFTSIHEQVTRQVELMCFKWNTKHLFFSFTPNTPNLLQLHLILLLYWFVELWWRHYDKPGHNAHQKRTSGAPIFNDARGRPPFVQFVETSLTEPKTAFQKRFPRGPVKQFQKSRRRRGSIFEFSVPHPCALCSHQHRTICIALK